MDIGEFAEMIVGHKLPEWQKNNIRVLYNESKNVRLMFKPIRINKGKLYTYIEQRVLRELTQK